MTKKKLGEILVNSGAVSGPDVAAALADQSAGEPSRLGDLLVATGKLSSVQLARALAEQYQLPYVDLPQLPQAVLDLVPLDLQRQFRLVPLKSDGTELSIAMADLANIEVLAVLEQQWTRVHVHVAGGDEIDALHATLSGIFSPIVSDDDASVPPSISPFPTADDLFGSLDLEPVEELQLTGSDSSPSPVPLIAPLHAVPRPSPAAPSSAGPRAEDLFGDLNLESARTGIAARPPEDILNSPVKNVTMPLGAVTREIPAIVSPVPDPPEVAELAEGSGPVLMGIREGTGPLLDMLFQEGSGPMGDLLLREGTGPVVDTPFFRDSSPGVVVPTMSDAPFASSRSSLSALAIPPLQSTMPEHEPLAPPVPDVSANGEALPDWLRTDAPQEAKSNGPSPWTGALDHLMPSKLVVGLTRALLARGLVTEEEILAALGQKK
ncbi:MAG: hypothetical protein Q8N23_22875 [Archangium sp.]|nr:hypothetical protein [Archangium sp.]MDP3155534.1 hypothetical protein [Archangium sp.]MDP3570860.1 hypothetical protein [Archangium sp.]